MDTCEDHGYLPNKEALLAELLQDAKLANEIATSAQTWASPSVAAHSDLQARPGYQSMSANEYLDTPEVLLQKVKILVGLMKKSKFCCVYSGAGISTAAGIDDYASKAETSVALPGVAQRVKSHFDAQPTSAHFGITALFHAGYIKHWVQQNHDGLPQKAGFPQQYLNEIHGAWYDPANPVIPMAGQLRTDLFEELCAWSSKADMCLVVGTSLAGMNADRVAQKTAKRGIKGHPGQFGTVIINLQKTQYDSLSCLRIFSKIDDVMKLVLSEFAVVPKTEVVYPTVDPVFIQEEDVFVVGAYDADGNKLAQDSPKKMILDLREEAKVKITRGLYAGHKGEVTGRHREGHYRVRILHPLKGTFMAPKEHTLGLWWIYVAVTGQANYLPLVNIEESLKFV